MKLQVTYRQIWLLAYPIIVGAIAHNLINVVNTYFLSQVGEVELGASALGGILYFVLVFFGAGLGTGAQILIARRTGESRNEEVGPAVDHTYVVFLSLGVLLFVLMRVGTGPLLDAIITSAPIRAATMDYLDIRSYEIWFALNFWVCRGIYTGIGRNRILIVATAALALVNITLDYALIFGNWGFPQMGIRGAAIATLCAEGVASLILIGNLFVRGHVRRFRMFRFEGLRFDLVQTLANLSTPIILQNLLSMGAWFAFFVVVENMGQHELAASNLIRSLYMVCMIPTWGLATAANALVSNVIGQGKPSLVLLVVRRVTLLSLSVSGVIALGLGLFPRTVLTIFTGGGAKLDPATIEAAVPGLYVIAAILLLLAAAAVGLQSTTATGATRFAFLLEVGLIFVYLSWVFLVAFVFKWGLTMVWAAEGVYWVLMAAACWWYLLRGSWRRLKL